MSADDPVIDAATVTDELTALRHRGLLNVEGTRALPVLQLPALDALARRYVGESAPVSRRIRLQRYLEAALNVYQEAGNTTEVDFIRPLFFDLRPETERIGTRSPGDLLKDARANTEIKDEKDFRDVQHTYFREFAAFLLASQPGAANIENEADRATPPLESDERVIATSQPGNATQRLVAGLAAALVIALVVIAGLIMELRQRSGAEPPKTPASTSPTLTPTDATLTFDDLGGGSPIIRVFHGATDSSEDRAVTGTFSHGDTVRTICKKEGREVTSDTSLGERPRKSSTWILIEGTPGVSQFARLTYARMSADDLAALPICP